MGLRSFFLPDRFTGSAGTAPAECRRQSSQNMTSSQLLGSCPARPDISPAPCASFLSRLATRPARLMLFAGLTAGAHALEVPYDYLVPCTPENAIFGYFSATKKPVVSVKSGS